jgi:hypothetical protein
MMRSWVAALVGVTYVACRGSEGLRDAQPDAPTDAAVDVADASDPPDAFVWPHETFVAEGELVVRSTEPCAEWVALPEPIETPPSASDAFTVKWRVAVEDDVAAGLGTIFVLPTLAPTGDLWFVSLNQHAPERRSLVLVRDGVIVRSPAAPAGSFVAAAPDGRVFTSREGVLFQLRAVETPSGTEIERESVRLGELHPDAAPSPLRHGGVVLGPGGMVYAAGVDEQSVFGICGSESPPRVMWERRFAVHPNITYASTVGHGMFVNPRGLHVQTQTDTWRLDEARYGVELLRFVLGRDGTVVEPPEPERSHQVVGVLGEGLLERETSPEAGPSTSLIRWHGEMAWTAPRLGFSAPARVLPNGEVWSQLDGLVVERRDASGALLEVDAFFPGWGGLVDSESRFIVLDRDPVARMTTQRVRDGSSSEVLLGRTYPPTFLPVVGTGNASILSPDGTVYIATGDEVVALQTDSLPPALDTCVNSGCNWRRDGWVR